MYLFYIVIPYCYPYVYVQLCHMTNLHSVDERERLLVALDDGLKQGEQRLTLILLFKKNILPSTSVPPIDVELEREHVKPTGKRSNA